LIGQTISHYRITAELGRGGMGVVYKAEDLTLRRTVALKFLSPHLLADPQQKKRFLHEAQAAAALDHPNITTIHEIYEADGQTFIAMAFVEGGNLTEKVGDGPMAIDEALDIAVQVARGLSKAHEAGVIHRDVKPGNVIVTPEGQAKVVDFGLAKLATQTRLTKSGTMVGTVAYMSPEQAAGDAVDHRTDIWSLGVMLYEMLSGELPFKGAVEPALLYSIMHEAPRPIIETRREVPGTLEDVLDKALTKDPAKRYQTMTALLSDLETQRDLISRGIKTPRSSLLRRLRRRRLTAPLLVLTATIAASAWLAIDRGWLPTGDAGNSGPADPRPWVMVAEFDAPRESPSLGVAARHLVIATLDESNIVEAVPTEQIRIGLSLAAMPETTRVDGAIAREIAYRSGIRTVVEGRIDRLGSNYAIVLRAVDADNGSVICSFNDTANGEDALIATLRRLAEKLREGLGEKRSALQQTHLRWTAATPSFEAYRKYAEAFEMQQMQGDDRGSLVLLREVLRIDPDFAEAWALKMFGHWHLSEMDSVRYALNQALRHPERLTEEGQMFLQQCKESLDGNFERADALSQELIRRGYQLSSSLGNRVGLLMIAGRYQEALDCARRAAHVGPFGPQQWVLANEIDMLLMFGLIDEARLESTKLRGTALAYHMAIPVAASDWTAADSLARLFRNDPTLADDIHEQALVVMACNRAAEGSLLEAGSLLRQAHSDSDRDFFLVVASSDRGRDISMSGIGDSTTGERVIRALTMAARSDTAEASRFLHGLSKDDLRDSGVRQDLVMALEHELAGRWRQATDLLAPLSRGSYRFGIGLDRVYLRWITAESFVSQDLPDSAAAYFELALTPGVSPWTSRLNARMLSSLVRLRLVSLYAQTGRGDEAARQFAILDREVTHPDADMTRLITEARAALEAAGQPARAGR
jgi:serine/threonine protein kinase/tetratricopeptide (TPR) repeat protein